MHLHIQDSQTGDYTTPTSIGELYVLAIFAAILNNLQQFQE
jgi:hypothetical protein